MTVNASVDGWPAASRIRGCTRIFFWSVPADMALFLDDRVRECICVYRRFSVHRRVPGCRLLSCLSWSECTAEPFIGKVPRVARRCPVLHFSRGHMQGSTAIKKQRQSTAVLNAAPSYFSPMANASHWHEERRSAVDLLEKRNRSRLNAKEQQGVSTQACP